MEIVEEKKIMTKKAIQITEKEAKIISYALSDYITTKRMDGEKNPNCDKYFLGFECGQIDCLRDRIEELFEVKS